MKTLGVVCARAGSERLPNKNLLELDGTPMFLRVARQADEATTIDMVVVSTDDARVIEIASAGTLVRRRPAELATNKAAIEGVLLDALDFTEKSLERTYDAVVFLPANSAVITFGLIDTCVKKLSEMPETTAVMTVKEVSEPPEWMWQKGLDDRLFPAYPTDRKNAFRMQDVPKRYIATGTVNVVRSEVLRKCRGGGAYAWMGDTILGVLDPGAIEIHTWRDYLLAKAVLEGEK